MNEKQNPQRSLIKYMLNGFFALLAMVGLAVAYFFIFQPAQNDPGIAIDTNATSSDVFSDATTTDVAVSSSFDYAIPPPAPKKSSKKQTTAAGSVQKVKDTSSVNNDASISSNSNTFAQTFSATTPGTSVTPTIDVSSGTSNETSATITPAVACTFPSAPATTSKKIILNEIAWMGTSGSKDEWMEIKNSSGNDIGLAGWELTNASGKIKIIFSDADHISAGGFLILSRASGVGKMYSGDLSNTGDVLAMMDPQCTVSDFLDASQGWPGGNNTTKQTLERSADGWGWHTSVQPGGTPGAENSVIASVANTSSTTPIVALITNTASSSPAPLYKLIVAFEGDGTGTITSSQPGFLCAATCTGSYPSGTSITLTPTAGKNSSFNSWSGLCYGQINCTFVLAANVSIAADFRTTVAVLPSPISSPSPAVPSPTPDTSSTPSPSPSPGHMLIDGVQIAGASSTNDLVKIVNPTAITVDVSGWKLRKRSQTGTEYSLRQFSGNTQLAPGQSLIWANGAGGFSESVGATVSSTETLAVNNSVGLIDATGVIIDEVAWGSGTGQYVAGSPYPTNPDASQTLARQFLSGVWVDTGNNASDFSLQ